MEHVAVHSAGPVVLSSPAQLVAPVLVARGTLSITTTEIYFEVDEDDPAFRRVDSKVSNLQASVQPEFKAGSLASDMFFLFFHCIWPTGRPIKHSLYFKCTIVGRLYIKKNAQDLHRWFLSERFCFFLYYIVTFCAQNFVVNHGLFLFGVFQFAAVFMLL